MHPDLRSLPKAELHLHIEGTLEPELAFALAERGGIRLPFADIADLRRHYDFTDLQSFLDLYYSCMAVLRTEQDFTDLALAYFERADADGIRHVEMFCDPQVHESNGVTLDTVLDGLLAAFRIASERWGITGGLIVCIVRDEPVASAAALIEELAPRAGEVLGIGLDSAEVGYPPSLFTEVFARARELGLHRVAHAGEEAPPAYIWEALRLLDVERVDHGIRAVDEPELVRHLAERRVPLTVCPLSNVRLRAVADLSSHPIRALVDAGVVVTVNSDDPAYFGGYIADNYAALAAAGFTLDELADLAANSIDASFADEARKTELRALVAEWRGPRRTAGDPPIGGRPGA
ncbi:adenosine deaminase [Microbacterium radiodurans]|uniref:Adenine deaminase n=1 Tax=Microbacterium radiodurans TaxID=661398 RepID=A0A5J5IT64_9MICO|nr:adenosine deaminase [Microbacterium radiodurans]KAA9089213.1 adenosine deaminase [Microbacterium radiodurans]